KISGKSVVWMGDDGEVYMYDGTATTKMTNTTWWENSPDIHAGTAVWAGGSDQSDIYFYDGETTVLLYNGTMSADEVQLYRVAGSAGTAGAQGPPGPQGDQGPKGDKGDKGDTGDAGSKGDQGIQGIQGVQGIPGDPGDIPDGAISFNQLSEEAITRIYQTVAAGIPYCAWQMDDGNDTEIMFYNGSSIIQITDNSDSDGIPLISGSMVVWGRSDGLYMYKNSAVSKIPDTAAVDKLPSISGNKAVWTRSVGTAMYEGKLYMYDGASTSIIANNIYVHTQAAIDGDYVVWEHKIDTNKDHDEIYLYNGTTIENISNNSWEDSNPVMQGGFVVWPSNNAGQSSLVLYNIQAKTQTVLTTNYAEHYDVFNGKAVWNEHDGQDFEIYLYDGGVCHQITDNNLYDAVPRIYGNKIVWGRNGDIFMYDGTSTRKISTAFPCGAPRIHGKFVVWTAGQTATEAEIYIYDSVQAKRITNNSLLDVLPSLWSFGGL
ncbi:hypothetical protein ACFL6F_04270, partial [Planctomycetota bacterium]